MNQAPVEVNNDHLKTHELDAEYKTKFDEAKKELKRVDPNHPNLLPCWSRLFRAQKP